MASAAEKSASRAMMEIGVKPASVAKSNARGRASPTAHAETPHRDTHVAVKVQITPRPQAAAARLLNLC